MESTKRRFRSLLDIDSLTEYELREIVELAQRPVEGLAQPLNAQGVACYFQKPSARTRNSTEMAVVQLGGHPVYLTNEEVGVDERETAEDLIRALSCYHKVFCGRVNDQQVLERMVDMDVMPIINLLSDKAHPLQAIADVITIEQEFGPIDSETKVAYVGDTNNVTRSLTLAVGLLGGKVVIASPENYSASTEDLDSFANQGISVETTTDPIQAVSEASVVYTDTWVSMGEEDQREQKLQAFEEFTVNDELMNAANDAIFMHCLPAHRGEEVTNEVIEGPKSRVWVQAGNRLAAARASLLWVSQAS